jgi:phosphoglycerate dehydrogenase-like enzyme
MKLLIPTGLGSLLSTPDGVQVVEYDPRLPVPPEHHDAEALVFFGAPADVQRRNAAALTGLRWVQTLSAGADGVLAAGFAPGVVITSGRGLHDGPVAEHTLALVLAAARRLNLLVRAQVEHRWAGELGGVQPIHDPGSFRTLRGAKVTVWGFGSIAATLAPLLQSLGAEVTGVARSAGTRAGYTVVADTDIPAVLPETDVLISLLPGTARNRGLVSKDVLALLPRHAWFVNVGRGSTVDEDALLAAIRGGTLGGAALDVFDTEPQPADSPLWDEPNIIISPHAAGGRPIGAADLVAENLRRYLDGEELLNLVERAG